MNARLEVSWNGFVVAIGVHSDTNACTIISNKDKLDSNMAWAERNMNKSKSHAKIEANLKPHLTP